MRLTTIAIVTGLGLFGFAGCDDAPDTAEGTEEPKDAAEGEAPSGDEKPAQDSGSKLSILTGSKTGNYYKAASELQTILGESGLELDIKESAGSHKNITELGSGKSALAIAQYDAIMAFLGSEDQKELANNSFVVAPLSLEYVHILTSKKAKIKSFKDLKGKRISVGPQNSGSWISATVLLSHLNGVKFGDANDKAAKKLVTLPYEDSIKQLVAGKLDAMFITTAPGMPLLKSLPKKQAKKIQLLSVNKKMTLPKALRWSYFVQPIPAKTYPFQKKAAFTLATPSYLLAYKDHDNEEIKKLAKAIYSQVDILKKKSDIWGLVSAQRARTDIENGIPYHQGVIDYLNN